MVFIELGLDCVFKYANNFEINNHCDGRDLQDHLMSTIIFIVMNLNKIFISASKINFQGPRLPLLTNFC